MKIVLLDYATLGHDSTFAERLRPIGEVTAYDRTAAAEVVDHAADADAVLTNKVALDDTLLSRLPHLKYIGVLATGYNIIDTEGCRRRGIAVTNVPAYSSPSVAQTVFALLLELTNRVGYYNACVTDGLWEHCKDFTFRHGSLTELDGKTMGILGFGDIGRRVGEIARAMGMEVITSSSRELPAWARRVGQDDLFRLSDVLSINSALTPARTGIINASTLAMMKPSAYLINTARGAFVNEADLADALRRGVIAGAGLDVLAEEPPCHGSPLIGLPNVVITPHLAWQSTGALERLERIAADNLLSFVNKKDLNRIV